MGHDITATYKGKKVAELRIGGQARRTTRIYDALGVPQFNRLDSGSGDSAMFTNLMLASAMRNSDTTGPYLTKDEFFFLDRCIQHNDGPEIKITFA